MISWQGPLFWLGWLLGTRLLETPRRFQVQQERIAEMERADAERRMLFLEQKAARDAVVEQRRNVPGCLT